MSESGSAAKFVAAWRLCAQVLPLGSTELASEIFGMRTLTAILRNAVELRQDLARANQDGSRDFEAGVLLARALRIMLLPGLCPDDAVAAAECIDTIFGKEPENFDADGDGISEKEEEAEERRKPVKPL